MTEAIPHHGKFIHPHRVFTAFKWLVYILLAWNAFQFFQEDLAASAVTFHNHISWRNVVEAFSASIDTTAWLVLLLVFEFETAIFTDEQLKGGLKWFLGVLKVFSYFLIIYSFYGYLKQILRHHHAAASGYLRPVQPGRHGVELRDRPGRLPAH